MQTTGLWIHGMGLVSPLGDTARATAAAVRAGISRRMRGSQVDAEGEALVVAPVPEAALPPLVAAVGEPRRARLVRLATWALREAAAGLSEGEAVPLLLAAPEGHPRAPALDLAGVFAELAAQSGVALATNSRLVAPGRAGALLGLADAYAMTEDPAAPLVLLGGVDSLLDPELLKLFERDRRTLAAGARDGFAAGEGAAFLLLSRRRVVGGSRASLLVNLPGAGHEDGHMYARAPHRGDGLAAAVADATRGCARGSIRTVYAGLNGEHYGAREWQVAALRSSEAFAGDAAVEHPGDCLGDPGAAFGPMLVVLAAVALANRVCAGPALVWAASDGPQRAAVVVGAAGGE
ncbi:MAG: hypothetical protein JNL82_19155 [Myxococcales bacterium]|nr:hypothetical protein [Myxococcales bacterium]